MDKLLKMVLLVGTLAISAVSAATEIAEVESAIKEKFSQVMQGFAVSSVKPSPIEGLYEVQVVNGPLLLVTADAEYFISGDLFSTAGGKLENVSELQRKEERMAQLKDFPTEELIVFSPEKETKRWIAVFTDVKCGYCRKFHNDVPALNDMGIEVRYFSFPIFDGSREQMVSALCADDPRKALTTLKSGGTLPSNQCTDQSIDKQFALARQFGLSGTPGIVFDDGTLLKGYVEPPQLAEQMGL